MSAATKDIIGPMMYFWDVVIIDVHDGDTIKVRIDQGFSDLKDEQNIRLFGINAPELNKPGGKAAKKFLESLIFSSSRHTKPKFLAPDVGHFHAYMRTLKNRRGIEQVGKYGRWLGEFYTPDGRNINQMMLEADHARRYPREKLRGNLVAA